MTLSKYKEILINIKIKISSKIKENPLHSLFYITAISLWSSIILFGSKFYVDERYHYRQIGWLWRGKLEIIPMLTTIPGYHAFIAMLLQTTDDISVMKARIISLFFSLFSIFIFYLIAKKIKSKDPLKKTLLFTFLPISFIYFPLVYTDMFSALLILFALYFVFKKNYNIAAVISAISIMSRQHNIIWHIFLWAYSYFLINNYSFLLKNIYEYIRRTFMFPVGIICFITFVFINGSVAVGDKNSHQMGFYLGNIYYFLAISGVLFLPIVLSAIIKKDIFFQKKIYIGIILSLIAGLTFFFFPPIIHGYNLGNGFLRNIIIMFIYHNKYYASIYSIFISLGIFSFFIIKMKKYSYILYFFIFLCLLPSWLIEQRYSIIPLMLILLLKEDDSENIEWFLVLYYFIFSVCLFLMIMNTKIFF